MSSSFGEYPATFPRPRLTPTPIRPSESYRDVQMPEPIPTRDHRKIIPSHWEKPKIDGIPPVLSNAIAAAFTIICLISLGHSSLSAVWDIVHHEDEEVWNRNKDRLAARISNITIVAGLLLGTTAAFLTTVPPQPGLIDYTETGPYICLLLAFGLTLGGLVVASAMLFVMSKCPPGWFCDSLMGSRSRICCTLFLVAYPFISIGSATAVGAIGLVVAATRSSNDIIKIGSVFVLIAPCTLIFVFGWTQLPQKHTADEKHEGPTAYSPVYPEVP